MKKILLPLLATIVLIACRKETDELQTVQNTSSGNAMLLKPILARTIATDLRNRIDKILAAKATSPYAGQFCNLCHEDCITIQGDIKHSYNTVTRNEVTLINEQFRYFNLEGISNLGKEYTGKANNTEITKIYPDNSWEANVDAYFHFGTPDGDSIIEDYSSHFIYSPNGELTINYLNDIKRCK